MDAHKFGHAIFIFSYLLLVATAFVYYPSARYRILQYGGWVFLSLGVLLLFLSERTRRRGKGLIKTGIYSLVRHPEFLGHIFIVLSMVLFAQAAISLVTGTVMLLILGVAIVDEEKMNVEKFGREYVEYMREVPRINIIAGIIRRMRAM